MANKLSRLFGSTAKPVKKTYQSYAEALADCHNEGYEDNQLCRVVAKKTARYKEQLNRAPFTVNEVQCYLAMVVQSILLESKINSIKVADFGGACGAHYFETRRLVPVHAKLNWTVIETPAMVAAATEYGFPNHELHFSSILSEIGADLFYLSSSIQYVPDPYGVIDSLIAKAYPWILFNRMMLNHVSDTDEVIVQQSMLSANGPGPMPDDEADKTVYYPHTTLSLQKFLVRFQNDYDLVWSFDESSGHISREPHISGGGFLFRKK